MLGSLALAFGILMTWVFPRTSVPERLAWQAAYALMLWGLAYWCVVRRPVGNTQHRWAEVGDARHSPGKAQAPPFPTGSEIFSRSAISFD
jgi:hypothetical protein